MAKDCTSPRTGTPSINTKIVQKTILEYRQQNMSFPDIGERLGFSQAYIYKLYKKALKGIIFETVETTRKIELQRLDDLQLKAQAILNTFHPIISQGIVVRDVIDDENGQPIIDLTTGRPVTIRVQDQGAVLSAIDRVLKIMERRAKLLGLDAPAKTALTNPSGDKPWNTPAAVQFYLPSNNREPTTVENGEIPQE